MNPEQALQRLAHLGLVEQRDGEWLTTEKWERALMRAEGRMLEAGEEAEDARVPVTYALVDVAGSRVPEAELEAMVEAILPLELAAEEELELDEELEAELEDLASQ